MRQDAVGSPDAANSIGNGVSQSAAIGVATYTGQQLGDAGVVRDEYAEGVKRFDKDDKAGRKAFKQMIRDKTPKMVEDMIEYFRPGTDAKPGSGGTANRSNAVVDALGKV